MRRITRQGHLSMATIPRFGAPFGQPIAPDSCSGSNLHAHGPGRLNQLLGMEQPILPDLFGPQGSRTISIRPGQIEQPLPGFRLDRVRRIVDYTVAQFLRYYWV